MVRMVSVRGIPGEILNSMGPELYGSVDPVGTVDAVDSDGQATEFKTAPPIAKTRVPKPVEEVINLGLRLL